jgi:paraquat-inducible protein B
MSTPDPDRLPQAAVKRKERRGLPLVWIVPLVAALIGAWLGVRAYLERGAMIDISFQTGEGLEAGKTKIKYKDVEVGVVHSVALADKGGAGVVASAEIAKPAAYLLRDDTRFWVVRPRISGGSVSGLSTLLGGSYLALDPGKTEKERRKFVGLESPPVVTLDVPGTRFVLRAEDLGSLDVAAPIYFRRVQVGQVVSFVLDEDGRGVDLQIFVRAPYDQYVTANTRFWNASGFDVNLDTSGLRIDTQSVVSILVGGIAFQTPEESALPTRAGEFTAFTLYADRASALKNPDYVSELFVFVFQEPVRGLSVGAPVEFRGIEVGEVTAIYADFDPVTKTFTSPVEARFYPERLRKRLRQGGVMPRDVLADPHQRLGFMIERGLRAQLRTSNLLTGARYITLDLFPEAAKVKVDVSRTPLEVPTVGGGLPELQASINRIAAKIEKLPLESISADARQALQSLDRTLKSADQLVTRIDREVTPEARATLEGARRSLAAVEVTLSNEAPLQHGIRATLDDLSRASDSLRALADYLERHPESLIRGKREDTP